MFVHTLREMATKPGTIFLLLGRVDTIIGHEILLLNDREMNVFDQISSNKSQPLHPSQYTGQRAKQHQTTQRRRTFCV